MNDTLTLKLTTRFSVAFCLAIITSLSVCGDAAVAQSGSKGQLAVSRSLPPRQLADGVLTIIPPEPQPTDTSIGPMPLAFVENHPELAWTAPDFPENRPNFAPASETLLELSRAVTLRHPVYQLEFAFKPVRTIEVPLKDGASEEPLLVWYLLYRVRYIGNDVTPNLAESDSKVLVPSEPRRTRSKAVLFVPKFDLIAHQVGKTYIDRVIPCAIPLIADRERVGSRIYDSVEMIRRIKLSTEQESNEVWGVACWTNIDPRTDFFTIAVEGVTNAYQLEKTQDSEILRKRALMLNFWRPGDSYRENEDEIRLGLPAYEDPSRMQYVLEQIGITERLAHYWTYR